MRRRAHATAWLALGIASAAACHHAPSPIIAEVEAHVGLVQPRSLLMPDDATLDAWVRRIVGGVPGPLTLAAPRQGVPRFRLRVDIATGWKDGKLGTAVHARIESIGEMAGGSTIDREGLVEKEGQTQAPSFDDMEAHLAHALDLVAGGVVRGEDLWLSPPQTARDALASKDDDLLAEAVHIAGERHDRQSVPTLLPLLKVDDASLRDSVIGALGEIGDPRAAKDLATLAGLGDLEQLPKIIDALSHVGGPEAESYLGFVASSHSLPEVRLLASRALEHMHARVDASAARTVVP